MVKVKTILKLKPINSNKPIRMLSYLASLVATLRIYVDPPSSPSDTPLTLLLTVTSDWRSVTAWLIPKSRQE